MPLDLPDPRSDRLERSPLELVVCQVRYANSPRVSKLAPALAVQAAIGGEKVWQLSQVETQTMRVADSDVLARPATSIESQIGWRLASTAPGWNVTLMPNSVALETTRYESWRDFAGRMGILLAAVKKDARPDAVGRIGLRYVDRIEAPEVGSAEQWGRWIEPSALGIARHPAFGPSILSCQQHVQLAADDDLKATIRHGIVPDGETGRLQYVMDFDTYREGVREFNVRSIQADLERLHRLSIQLFQAMITDELYSYLRGDA